jgi:very-short-patch-repair endonuclease
VDDRTRAAIARVAGRQRGNIRYDQLRSAGVTASEIKYFVRIGYLHRVHRGVYSVGRPPATPEDRAAAAVLACGELAALAHFGAAALWAIWEHWPTRFDVIAPTDRRRPGIATHLIVLPDTDIRHRLGIRVTSPPRALLDCAPSLSDDRRIRMVNSARVNKATRVTDAQIADIIARNPHHPGAKLLRWFVEDDAGHVSESHLEDVLFPWCDAHGLPRPQTQVQIGNYRVDAAYLVEKVVLELDGYLSHSGRESFEGDRDRDADMADYEFIVIRLTSRRLKRQPVREAARLQRILDARRRLAA